MSYKALYRKLRPQNFEQVIGQDHITKTLKNQVKNSMITHAYLFCGTRGTGKTSTAKIFAKLLNCEKPENLSPCNKCEMCINFQENRSLNTIEVDAASNNSVDYIRDLREEVKYPPTKGKYKIYIIDEVHMLSIGAFNALLKTLEEPPSYVIFILATTDPQKIPITILSRCQRFDFKRILVNDIVSWIKASIVTENIQITEEALNYIAYVADGAMRDALSILEQCASFYYDKEIELKDVMQVLGNVDDNILFEFTDFLIDLNSVEVLNTIDLIVTNGKDISQFVLDLIQHFRNLIVVNSSQNTSNLYFGEDKIKKYMEQAKKCQPNYFINLINIFSKTHSEIKNVTNGRIILEATCIKLCNAIFEEDITDLKQKIKFLELKMQENSSNVVYLPSETKKEEKNQEPINLRELVVPEDFQDIITNWSKILKKADSFLLPLYQEGFKKAMVKTLEDKFLYLVFETSLTRDTIKKYQSQIEEEIAKTFNFKVELKFLTIKEFEKKYLKVASYEPKDQENLDIKEEAFKNLDESDFEIQD